MESCHITAIVLDQGAHEWYDMASNQIHIRRCHSSTQSIALTRFIVLFRLYDVLSCHDGGALIRQCEACEQSPSIGWLSCFMLFPLIDAATRGFSCGSYLVFSCKAHMVYIGRDR